MVVVVVVRLAGWLDGVVGAVTTRESNYNTLAGQRRRFT